MSTPPHPTPQHLFKPLVFLGGTCGNNPWREPFMAHLVAQGIDPDSLFNPVVPDWNEEAQRQEEDAKTRSTHFVFYIADPKQEGIPISTYSIVEAVIALSDNQEKTVVVFDTTGITGHPLKSMQQTEKILRKRFPKANIFSTPEDALRWLSAQLAPYRR